MFGVSAQSSDMTTPSTPMILKCGTLPTSKPVAQAMMSKLSDWPEAVSRPVSVNFAISSWMTLTWVWLEIVSRKPSPRVRSRQPGDQVGMKLYLNSSMAGESPSRASMLCRIISFAPMLIRVPRRKRGNPPRTRASSFWRYSRKKTGSDLKRSFSAST